MTNLLSKSTRGLRLVVRDLDGDTCTDYVADVMPEQPAIKRLFPLKPLRSWRLSEAVATFTARGTSFNRVAREMKPWALTQVKALNRRGGERVPLVLVDELCYDPIRRRWWKPEATEQLMVLFDSLHRSRIVAWENLCVHFGARPVRTYANAAVGPEPHGLPLGPMAAPFFVPGKPAPTGYWNIEHALLPTREFIRRFVDDILAAEAATALALLTASLGVPVAHTGLVRPPAEWITALIGKMNWCKEHAIQAAGKLSDCVAAAELSPLHAGHPIRALMDGSFDIARDFLSGSYARHTKTKPLKDVDIVCVLGADEEKYREKGPTALLDAVAKVLVTEYGRENVEVQRRSVGFRPHSTIYPRVDRPMQYSINLGERNGQGQVVSYPAEFEGVISEQRT